MSTWKTLAAACVAGTFTLVSAQEKPASTAPPGKVMQLTALDYLDIQQLVTRYAFALDSGADNGRMFAGLFSKDGGFARTTGDLLATREALADAARRGMKGPMGISHFIMNHVIEPTADGAIGKQYAAIFDIGNNNGPSSLRAGGTYEDVYVKTPEGWRFKRRQYTANKWGPLPSYRGAPFNVPVRLARPSAQAAASASSLSPEDYVELQQLTARYPYGLETGYDSGYMYADLFTPNGAFGTRSIGREALKALAWQHRPGQGPLYVRNFHTNVRIDPSADGARGRIYQMVLDIPEGDKPSTILNGGHYEDAYVRTPAGWRINKRQYIGNKPGPDFPDKPQPERSRQTTAVPLVRAKDAKAMKLTAQDYIDIQQLTARYSHALDTASNNGYDYADLFVADGAAFDRWIGREQIASIPPIGARQPSGPDYVRHYAMNHLIEPTANGAIGKQYVIVIDHQKDGKPSTIFLGGQYQDVYVKTAQGWRFKTRTEFRSQYVGAAPASSASR